MKSSRPKHLHELLGRRLIDWVLDAARSAAAEPLVVVTSPQSEAELRATVVDDFLLAIQDEPRGTGDALGTARTALEGFEGDVLVLAGDTPLVTANLLRDLVEEHRAREAAVTVLSFEPFEPGAYGRIIRDKEGALTAIVEARDATPEILAVREVNSSIYVFGAEVLWRALDGLGRDNAQGELYLTDAVGRLVEEGLAAAVYLSPDPALTEGVNTRAELARAAAALRDRVLEELMLDGVTIVDPATTWVEAEVTIEPDVVIHPYTALRGRSVIRRDAEVGPHAVVVDSEVGPGALVGPFCYLRPGTVLAAGAKAGTFVEMKNAVVGERSKVPHLSYIGDAEIGRDSNIAAGAITANYRPELEEGKQRTVIGSNVHTGSDNVFVAPVEIGDNAWVGAGSTITDDVPPGALAIARTRQINKEGYSGGKRHD
jgi:bifunctional UDP-N-acetylglucosamine pyrophosphorylase/glucosamine-1-phosphate N-acetyltransferase